MSKSPRYFFICNPAANSGRVKKKWDKIKDKIEEFIDPDSFEWSFTEGPLHGIELARDVSERDFTHIISVGGDGIANEIANALMNVENKPIFGMIPAGTSNDAHQSHNFPNDAMKTLDTLFEDNVEKFPVGKATGDFGPDPHYFIDHCDCGIAALAARSGKYGTNLLRGEWKYTYYAIKNIIRFNKNPGKVTIDGELFEGEYAIVAAGFGDMMSGYKLWPGNHNRKGDFGILMARGHSRFGLLRLMLQAEKGNHIGKEGVSFVRGKNIKIELENEWPYQAEGEIFTEDSKIMNFEYIPDALSIITSKVD